MFSKKIKKRKNKVKGRWKDNRKGSLSKYQNALSLLWNIETRGRQKAPKNKFYTEECLFSMAKTKFPSGLVRQKEKDFVLITMQKRKCKKKKRKKAQKNKQRIWIMIPNKKDKVKKYKEMNQNSVKKKK